MTSKYFWNAAVACALALATALPAAAQAPFSWNSATIYLAFTDRFNNADRSNDFPYGRKAKAAPLRSFAGGDLTGISAKIKDGYFNRLGVDAIWITPPVEQIHGAIDEGRGDMYGFHGYWAKDFTSVDANFGTAAELQTLVDTAHAHGIRVLLDVVMNQTGPVSAVDPVWPAEWVRTDSVCTYKDYRTTVDCMLVPNLPDFRTDSNTAVALPPALAQKWKAEGRYERETAELDAFFTRTGYPRAPRYYLIKWHADWVRKYGFDGFRADTVKHVDPIAWKELKLEASTAFEDWKRAHPRQKLGDDKFYMMAEVYNYAIGHGQLFDIGGGKRINYFGYGFDALINFSMKSDAQADEETLFSSYSALLQGPLKGKGVVNYMSSHDDDSPFDPTRKRPYETAIKLLLAPGAAQIYYGDESARSLLVPSAPGDATLRSFMNWDALANDPETARIHQHWQRLGQFRHAHMAVGSGVHKMLQASPYVFKRTFESADMSDRVVVALGLTGDKPTAIPVSGVFRDGQVVKDWYSGQRATVAGGCVLFAAHSAILLIAQE